MLMVDDDVVSESEWDLVLVLENLKCELNGIETLFLFFFLFESRVYTAHRKYEISALKTYGVF